MTKVRGAPLSRCPSRGFRGPSPESSELLRAVASSCAQGQETGPHEASWLSSSPFLSCPSFPACASAFPGVLLEKGLRPLQMCAAPSKHQLCVLLPPSYSHGTIVASADTSRSSTRAAPWMTRGPQGASGSTDIGWSCFFLSCRCPCFLPHPCFLRPETAFGDPARGPPRAAPHWSLKVPNPKHSDLALQLVVLGIPIQTNWTETHGNCLCLLASG